MASLLRGCSECSSSSEQVDQFVSGLEGIQLVGGGILRFRWFVNHGSADDGGLTRLLVPRSLIMPADALPDAIGKAMAALGRQVIVRPDGSVTMKQ